MSLPTARLSARQLEFFLAVIDAGSVTRAAEQLHISQPSVSEAIRNLEHELGATLFTRHRGGMEATAAGVALTGPAKQLLDGLRRTEVSARALTNVEMGRLEISSPSGLIAEPLTGITARFHARHPNIQIDIIRPSGIDRVVRLVQEHRCDVGFTFLTNEVPDVLAVHELAPLELCLAFPPDAHPPVGAVNPEQLAELPVIALRSVTTPRRTLDRYCSEHGVSANIVVETNHEGGHIQLVHAGAGVALLSKASTHLARGMGLPVRSLEPPIEVRNGLVHRREEPSPAARAFIDLVCEER